MNRKQSVARLKLRHFLPALAAVLPLLPAARANAQEYVYYTPVGSCQASCGANLDPGGNFLQAADGTIYGTAAGGANGSGAVFSFKKTSTGLNPLTIIYNFSALQGANQSAPQTNSDGGEPQGLTMGTDGNLYGVTGTGGASGSGTVFSITTAGVLTTLYTFTAFDANGANTDGYDPDTLIEGPDGNFYGTARFGGPGSTGTVFRITPSGSFTVIYSFPPVDVNNSNTNGSQPLGLILGADGNFYAVTLLGGANGVGTIFKISPDGIFTLLHTMTRSTDGAQPDSLMQASDGNFYGTAESGGADGWGTIFQITPSGQFTTLYQFGTISANLALDDFGGASGLFQGPDGNLYGTTPSGYTECGTVFGITPTGHYSILFEFSDGCGPNDSPPVGAHPTSGLILGVDGNVYGLSDVSIDGSDFGGVYQLQFSPTPLLTLTAQPNPVVDGQPVTLSWTSNGGGCFNIDGGALPANGSAILIAATLYDIECLTTLGEGTAYTLVDILPAPPTATIAASPSTLTLGSQTTITWSTSNATSCTAGGSWTGNPHLPSGTQTETPSKTGISTFTLECTGPGGSISASANVTVVAATPPTIAISVSPTTETSGIGAPQLTWSTTSATSCTASGAWSGTQPVNGSTELENLAPGTYTYTLTCTGPAGSATASAQLEVVLASKGSGGGGSLSPLTLGLLTWILVLRTLLPAKRATRSERANSSAKDRGASSSQTLRPQ